MPSPAVRRRSVLLHRAQHAILLSTLPPLLAACAATGIAAPAAASLEARRGELTVAQPAPAPDGALATFVRAALRDGPMAVAARARTEAAAAASWQQELWPNPRLRAEVRDIPSGGRTGTSAQSQGGGHGGGHGGGTGRSTSHGGGWSEGEDWLVVMQPVEVSGRRGAAIEAAREGYEAARHREQADRRAVAAEVGRAWAEAAWDAERAPLVAETARIAVRRREIADARVREHTLADPAAFEVRAAAAAAEVEARAMARELAVHAERLASLAGTVPGDLAVPGDDADAWSPLPELDRMRSLCAETNPELLAARAAAGSARLRVDEARAGRVPAADLMIGVGRMPDGERAIEAGISFPLPVFDRNQAKIREARAEAAMAAADLESKERMLRAELASDHATLLEARERRDALRTVVVPAALRAAEQTRAARASGASSESAVLDAEESLAKARIDLAAASRDVRLAEIEIRRHLPAPHGIPGVEP